MRGPTTTERGPVRRPQTRSSRPPSGRREPQTKWTGRRGPVNTDTETGFQYLRARYYDPGTATFLTRDPIEAITQEPYGYVGGNPLNYVDPSGRAGSLAEATISVDTIGALAGIATVGLIGLLHQCGDDLANGLQGVLDSMANDAAPDPAPLPSAEDLRGKTVAEIEQLLEGWAKTPGRKGDGTRFVNPKNPSEVVTVLDGNPVLDPSLPAKQGPYARISDPSSGRSEPIPLAGNPAL